VAEEYAMLDLMSGGRMEYGIPLGTGMEYWANAGQINPATARARFREALEVILQTWTEKGPTRYDGDFYNYRHLNVWPRPLQQPHPKLYIVGSGSKETVTLAADHCAGYSIVFTPIGLVDGRLDRGELRRRPRRARARPRTRRRWGCASTSTRPRTSSRSPRRSCSGG
jgi:alkanesulfonate monooxygenase SsuD/methylene tetrahydromethanopterin reductase-like flavin-dependent oxidoreductase (luciferase family)